MYAGTLAILRTSDATSLPWPLTSRSGGVPRRHPRNLRKRQGHTFPPNPRCSTGHGLRPNRAAPAPCPGPVRWPPVCDRRKSKCRRHRFRTSNQFRQRLRSPRRLRLRRSRGRKPPAHARRAHANLPPLPPASHTPRSNPRQRCLKQPPRRRQAKPKSRSRRSGARLLSHEPLQRNGPPRNDSRRSSSRIPISSHANHPVGIRTKWIIDREGLSSACDTVRRRDRPKSICPECGSPSNAARRFVYRGEIDPRTDHRCPDQQTRRHRLGMDQRAQSDAE